MSTTFMSSIVAPESKGDQGKDRRDLISLGMPIFTDRYLITIAPAFYLLLACGLEALRMNKRNHRGPLQSWRRRSIKRPRAALMSF